MKTVLKISTPIALFHLFSHQTLRPPPSHVNGQKIEKKGGNESKIKWVKEQKKKTLNFLLIFLSSSLESFWPKKNARLWRDINPLALFS